jgi:DNA-binding GntR family transcriptional regulator
MKSPELASDEPALRISKLERERLHDRAYLEVKKAIMCGAIRPGATITIRAMAAALGTSPMPVREALSRLVAERALVMLPTRYISRSIELRACRSPCR